MAQPATHSRTRLHVRRKQTHTAGASLGIHTQGTNELIRELQRGLPVQALQSFSTRSGLPISRITSALDIAERTLARRRVAGRLAPEESERLLRLSRVFEKTVDLFEGDTGSAAGWLLTPRRALSEQSPLDYLRTEIGAREVENLIGRLEHGVFS
jgi:putative toxin-antitoxin system antitoxin component (TIGR02293 family)